LVVGCRLNLRDGMPVLAYPTDRATYGRPCRLTTLGKARTGKGGCDLAWADLLGHGESLPVVLIPDAADDAMAGELRRLAEAAKLALQHAFQAPEHTLNAPTRAVEFGNPAGRDCLGQVALQPPGSVAILGGLVQRKLDTLARSLSVSNCNLFLAHRARLGAAAILPLALLDQMRMVGVLAHDETGSRVLEAPQHRAGAKVPIGHP